MDIQKGPFSFLLNQLTYVDWFSGSNAGFFKSQKLLSHLVVHALPYRYEKKFQLSNTKLPFRRQQFNKQVHSDNDASEVDNSGHLRIFWHILGQFGGHFDEFGAFRLFSPLFPTIFTRYRLIRKKRVTDGRTDGRTDRRTDVRTDGQTLLIEMLGRI